MSAFLFAVGSKNWKPARAGAIDRLAPDRRLDMMKTKLFSGAVVGLLVLTIGWGFVSHTLPARGDAAAGKDVLGGPRYSVVETEGHNLIVTDNQTNTLYFYTIDKDAKIGSEMKMRGMIDLKQVGKEVLKPTNVKLRD